MLNANTINTTFSIPSGSNGMSAGPVTVATGVTVTVPTGSTWVIV
jgi:glycine cleavage system protein P-like pyridoxal-binding family